MFRNWWFNYGEGESLAVEEFFEFEFDGVTIVGVIDRIGPLASGGTRITDFKTGNPNRAGAMAVASAVRDGGHIALAEGPEIRCGRPGGAPRPGVVPSRLAHDRSWRAHHTARTRRPPAWQVSHRSAEQYQTAVRETLSTLIAEQKRLIVDEVYRPNSQADCFWCDFRTLCPIWPEGRQVFEVAKR